MLVMNLLDSAQYHIWLPPPQVGRMYTTDFIVSRFVLVKSFHFQVVLISTTLGVKPNPEILSFALIARRIFGRLFRTFTPARTIETFGL